MTDFLHLVFRSFWTFLGTLLLVTAAACWRPITIDRSVDNSTDKTINYGRDGDDN